MIAVLSAPTNLGQRPPEPGSVPGCAKAPDALKEAGLLDSWPSGAALDAGTVLAGRYVDPADPPSGRLRNQTELVAYSRRLAARLTGLLDAGQTPLVLGGDCSLLLGVGLALRRRGLYGLVHIDGHTDFRNPGNSRDCFNAAGEDLAIVVGRHWADVADMLRDVDGYWVHVDVDVLDPEHMPAVDFPDPGGLTPDELGGLLATLAPTALGCDITIFDPDLDPSGLHAATLVAVVRDGLHQLGRLASFTR